MRKLMILVAVLALMLVLAAPAFAFDLVGGVTYGGNCVVNDVVEICTLPLDGGF